MSTNPLIQQALAQRQAQEQQALANTQVANNSANYTSQLLGPVQGVVSPTQFSSASSNPLGIANEGLGNLMRLVQSPQAKAQEQAKLAQAYEQELYNRAKDKQAMAIDQGKFDLMKKDADLEKLKYQRSLLTTQLDNEAISKMGEIASAYGNNLQQTMNRNKELYPLFKDYLQHDSTTRREYLSDDAPLEAQEAFKRVQQTDINLANDEVDKIASENYKKVVQMYKDNNIPIPAAFRDQKSFIESSRKSASDMLATQNDFSPLEKQQLADQEKLLDEQTTQESNALKQLGFLALQNPQVEEYINSVRKSPQPMEATQLVNSILRLDPTLRGTVDNFSSTYSNLQDRMSSFKQEGIKSLHDLSRSMAKDSGFSDEEELMTSMREEAAGALEEYNEKYKTKFDVNDPDVLAAIALAAGGNSLTSHLGGLGADPDYAGGWLSSGLDTNFGKNLKKTFDAVVYGRKYQNEATQLEEKAGQLKLQNQNKLLWLKGMNPNSLVIGK